MARRRPQEADFRLDEIGEIVESAYARVSRAAPILDHEGQLLAVPAPNAIEWATGPTWANVHSLYRYTRQYQVIRDLFELRCPLCNPGGTEDGEPGDCWGKGQEYLESEALLIWSPEYQEDACPKCRTTRSEFVEDGLFHNYKHLHAIVGQRSGKSVLAGIIGTYIEHRITTVGISTRGGLAKYFGLLPGDAFEIMFLASTGTQSSDTIWSKFTAVRSEAPWFQRFIPWAKEQEKRQPRIDGMQPWHYKENDDRIENLHPGVRTVFVAGHSNSSAIRGLTRIAAFGDEVSHMLQTDSARGAREILGALERSLATVRTSTVTNGCLPWLGMFVTVSSPVSRSDYGWQLLQVDDVESLFRVHRATWDFNPNIKRSDLEAEFRKDPVASMRDYGAVPPGAEYPYIHDEIRWREAVQGDHEPLVTFKIDELVDPLGHQYLRAKVDEVKFAIGSEPRIVVIDAGVSFDALSLSVGHMKMVEQNDDLVRRTVVDGVLRVVPTDSHAVWFQAVVDIIEELKKVVPVQLVEFDRWESVKLIQDIRQLGIFAERRSLGVDDYRAFKNDSFAGLVKMLPPDEGDLRVGPGFAWTTTPDKLSGPSAAYYEICGLQQDPDTGKVYNPAKGRRRGYDSNDTAQTVIHLSTIVQNSGYTEKHDDRSRRAARKRLEDGASRWGADRGGLVRTTVGARTNKRGW